MLLSTAPASAVDRRLAVAVVTVSTLLFVCAVPFAKTPLARVDAFIPIYQSALVITDLITAVLLFSQFSIMRSRALLMLASGYLFTSFMAIAHALTFPGLFAPTGLLDAGPQTTAWLYMFWHAGFPILVIAYVLIGHDNAAGSARRRVSGPILACVGLALAAVILLTALATAGPGTLPSIMDGNHYTTTMIGVVSSVWLLSVAALLFVVGRRTKTLLDVWLSVVMFAWIFDIALSAVFNAGRFDVGFYSGRIYGLLASSFVLVVLLIENATLYKELAEAHDRVRERTTELEAANKELDAFSYSVSHDLRAPLRAVDFFARTLAEDYSNKLDAEATRLLGIIRSSAQRMSQLIDDLLAFSRLGRAPVRVQTVPLEPLVHQIVEDLRMQVNERRVEFAVGALGTVSVDPSLFRQALTNLLSNAIKFTRDRDPAIIEVGRRRETATDGALVYYVKDNGAGFDMKYSQKLFGVFQRLHSPNDFPGTGVGLAIVQRIIVRHGGAVWAEAKPNEGATIYFTLPRATDNAA